MIFQHPGIHYHLVTIMPLYQCGDSFGWTRIAYLDMTDQLKSVPHLGQSLIQEIRECAFEVPVQELVVTLLCTVIPNRSTAKCVAASLDTSSEE